MPEVQRQFDQLHGEIKTSTVAEWFTKLNERFDMMEKKRGSGIGVSGVGKQVGGWCWKSWCSEEASVGGGGCKRNFGRRGCRDDQAGRGLSKG
jgi:hypothetical protein